METRIRKDPTLVSANVGVPAGVEITLALDRSEGEGAAMHIGHKGPEVMRNCANPDSLDWLTAVTTDGGARQFRDRDAANDGVATSNNANLLITMGVAR